MSDCVFCKIIKGEIPSSKVYENEKVVVFRDINPAAPIHVLVVPKVHIESLEALNQDNIGVVTDIHAAILETTRILGINEEGYRVIVNCGKNGGQTVPHLHYHILGGARFDEKII
ncbi:MAG: histidine triad nucleotide-binding protein [Clostridiaceae bacterium]|jgi:histidine triad (HIT) family protein|nr:histidine triad nucleotide-binding protein [Clostridiaceae bacterium]